ncbi:hypothetical protein Dimus_014612 [Dionaea muscipula]
MMACLIDGFGGRTVLFILTLLLSTVIPGRSKTPSLANFRSARGGGARARVRVHLSPLICLFSSFSIEFCSFFSNQNNKIRQSLYWLPLTRVVSFNGHYEFCSSID